MSKYRAIPTTIDGIRFASKAEARRYTELRLLLKAEQITDLLLQPAFVLTVTDPFNGRKVIGRYIADFQYLDISTGRVIVEDVKGVPTPLYRWKKKHVEAQYGIVITEIKC